MDLFQCLKIIRLLPLFLAITAVKALTQSIRGSRLVLGKMTWKPLGETAFSHGAARHGWHKRLPTVIHEKWIHTSFVAWVFFGMTLYSQDISAFDFLNIPPTASMASYGVSPTTERGTIEGLWGNPASLAGMAGSFSALISNNNHFGMKLLSGGTSFGIGPLQLGMGTTALLPGEIQNDSAPNHIQEHDDSCNLLFTCSGALRLGELLSLPFGLDIGGSLNYVNESIARQTISSLLLDSGIIFGFEFSKYIGLNIAAEIKHLGIQTFGTEAQLPYSLQAGVRIRMEPSDLFRASLFFQMGNPGGSGICLALGSEIQYDDTISFKFGMTTAGNVINLSMGVGLQFNFETGSKMSVWAGFKPKNIPEGEAMYQVSFHSKRNKQLSSYDVSKSSE